MNELFDTLFVLILTLNLFALCNGRLLSVIKLVAAQGILLGLLPLFMHERLRSCPRPRRYLSRASSFRAS